MICRKSDADSIDITAQSLVSGKVVIIPTDTVYGFSGIVDAKDSKVKYKTDDMIRKIKGREESKPLIQLISSPEDLSLYTDDVIPENILAKWPGALTIIVNLKKELTDSCPTVAFRCPGDEWLRKVIKLCNRPIYSTSVNRSGSPVLETMNEIQNEFEKEVDLIVFDKDTKGSKPSTLIKIDDGKVVVLRQGSVQV